MHLHLLYKNLPHKVTLIGCAIGAIVVPSILFFHGDSLENVIKIYLEGFLVGYLLSILAHILARLFVYRKEIF